MNEQSARAFGPDHGRPLINSVGDLAASLLKAKGDVSRAISRIIQAADEDLKAYPAEAFASLLRHPDLENTLVQAFCV